MRTVNGDVRTTEFIVGKLLESLNIKDDYYKRTLNHLHVSIVSHPCTFFTVRRIRADLNLAETSEEMATELISHRLIGTLIHVGGEALFKRKVAEEFLTSNNVKIVAIERIIYYSLLHDRFINEDELNAQPKFSVLAGRIDCIIEFQGKVYIIDWKTTSKHLNSVYHLNPNYLNQMTLYAYLYKRLMEAEGRQVNIGGMAIVYLSITDMNHLTVPLSYVESKATELLERIKVVGRILRGEVNDVETNPEHRCWGYYICNFCPLRAECRKFKLSLHEENNSSNSSNGGGDTK